STVEELLPQMVTTLLAGDFSEKKNPSRPQFGSLFLGELVNIHIFSFFNEILDGDGLIALLPGWKAWHYSCYQLACLLKKLCYKHSVYDIYLYYS
ncbi:hypothetical protein ACJX0J_023131, partial [Zea mays]